MRSQENALGSLNTHYKKPQSIEMQMGDVTHAVLIPGNPDRDVFRIASEGAVKLHKLDH